jgi:acetyltransferase-like isoleucine patch superfamily enzyme
MDLVLNLRVLKAFWRHAREFTRRQVRIQQWRKRGVLISDPVLIETGPNARLEIGEGSSIGPYTLIDLRVDPNPARGVAVPSSMLVVGRRTAINEFNNIRAAGGTIRIGDDCLISQFVSIIASNHSVDTPDPIRDQPWDTQKTGVEIGNGVWIGAHAAIMPGVRIGDGSVVAAGAVVTRDVPPRAVVAGVPATVRRFRAGTSIATSPDDTPN